MQFKSVWGKRKPIQPDARTLQTLFFTIRYPEHPFYPYIFSENGDVLNVQVKDGIEKDKVVSDLRKHSYVTV